MKKERVFSKDGSYQLCLHSNALMHREAADLGEKLLNTVLMGFQDTPVVHVLDLACGGLPVTIADIIERFPAMRFTYTGIDINPDQTKQLRTQFEFSENVIQIDAITGTAWDLADEIVQPQLRNEYHIIFSGFNLHHGTPEELFFLAQQLYGLIHPDGVFFNVDEYRPNNTSYVRRPDKSLDNSGESFFMVDPAKISANLYKSRFAEASFEETPDWKRHLIQLLNQSMHQAGGKTPDIESILKHVRKRDFPVSANEMSTVFADAGFFAKTDYHSEYYPDSPLAQYYAMLVAKKSD